MAEKTGSLSFRQVVFSATLVAVSRSHHRGGAKRIAILVLPGFQSLDAIGPAEVFATAGLLAARSGHKPSPYSVEIWAESVGPISSWTGLQFIAQRSYERARVPIDTVLIAGGGQLGQADYRPPQSLLRFLQHAVRKARRVASVCTGAFALAEAGLLDGLSATTHWAHADELARRYPKISVEPDALFTKSGSIYTSAGISAGMDLALSLVQEDLGRSTALATAKGLVLFLKRPGGQSQFSEELRSQLSLAGPMADLQRWIMDHLHEDLTVRLLAKRVAMSERNFQRVFRSEFDDSPARFVERMRVARARRLLEAEDLHLEEVAHATGFGNAERMRKSFQRSLDITPSEYRQRFATPGTSRT